MKTVTMLELRNHAKEIVERAQHGERMLLLYRGAPSMILEPYRKEEGDYADDPIFSLPAVAGAGESLTNEEMDEAIYG